MDKKLHTIIHNWKFTGKKLHSNVCPTNSVSCSFCDIDAAYSRHTDNYGHGECFCVAHANEFIKNNPDYVLD